MVQVMNLLQKYVEPITYAAQATLMLYGERWIFFFIFFSSVVYFAKTLLILQGTAIASNVFRLLTRTRQSLRQPRKWLTEKSLTYFTSPKHRFTTLLALLAPPIRRTTAGL